MRLRISHRREVVSFEEELDRLLQSTRISDPRSAVIRTDLLALANRYMQAVDVPPENDAIKLYSSQDPSQAQISLSDFSDALARVHQLRGNRSGLRKLRRQIAAKLHPDIAPPELKAASAELFKFINYCIDEAAPEK